MTDRLPFVYSITWFLGVTKKSVFGGLCGYVCACAKRGRCVSECR